MSRRTSDFINFTITSQEKLNVTNKNTCENGGKNCCSVIKLMLYPITSPLAKLSSGFSHDTLREYGERGNTDGGGMNTGAKIKLIQ